MSGELHKEAEIRSMVEGSMDQRLSMDQAVDIAGTIPRFKADGIEFYPGKVRLNVTGPTLQTGEGIPLRLIVATGNLSTHDEVRGVVPLKQQILTEGSDYFLEVVAGTLPSSQLLTAGSNVVVAENCAPIDVEVVLRAYMAKSTTKTSLYHHYVNEEGRYFCGHVLPEGLVANGKLPYLMDTPSTKERVQGHDISVPPQHLFDHRLCTPLDYRIMLSGCTQAWGRAENVCLSRGIIVADTKFEVGRNSRGDIVFIDEVMTPDASRYWDATDYAAKMEAGEAPTSFSKQFARDIGEPGQPFTDDDVFEIAVRYVQAHEMLTGKRFEPDARSPEEALVTDVNTALDELGVPKP